MPRNRRLRLGRISYFNVLPVYYPLESGIMREDVDIVHGTPAALNDAMARDELDVSSTSSIAYARHPEKYLLVPELAIGSSGPVQSVLLLSRTPIMELDGSTIMVSSETNTSAALLRILLEGRMGLAPTYRAAAVTPLLDSGMRPEAFLAIGDEALRLRSRTDYPHRLDLGEAWMRWTGLPFIFGVWIVSRKTAAERGEDLARLCLALRRARTWSRERMDFFAERAAQQGMASPEEMHSYFSGLVYDLGPWEQLGLKRFYENLAEHGEIARPPALEFFDPDTVIRCR